MGQDEWVAIMVRGAGKLAAVPYGLAIIDPRSGHIAYHNPAMERLAATPIPDTINALDERGLVPADARERLLAAGRDHGDEDSCTRLQVPVARPDGRPVDTTVHVSHLHAHRGEGRVISVVAADFDNTFVAGDLEQSPDPPSRLQFAFNLDGVCVAADQRLVEYGVDPTSHVGAHWMLTTHPEDVPRISRLARPVYSGESPDADYAVRAIGAAGAWTNLRCHTHRLEGSPALVIAELIPDDALLPTVDPGLLTERELEVVRALFAGKRPAQIAEDHDVSVRTVRNQIASVLKKLGVTSQAELTDRYSPPR